MAETPAETPAPDSPTPAAGSAETGPQTDPTWYDAVVVSVEGDGRQAILASRLPGGGASATTLLDAYGMESLLAKGEWVKKSGLRVGASARVRVAKLEPTPQISEAVLVLPELPLTATVTDLGDGSGTVDMELLVTDNSAESASTLSVPRSSLDVEFLATLAVGDRVHFDRDPVSKKMTRLWAPAVQAKVLVSRGPTAFDVVSNARSAVYVDASLSGLPAARARKRLRLTAVDDKAVGGATAMGKEGVVQPNPGLDPSEPQYEGVLAADLYGAAATSVTVTASGPGGVLQQGTIVSINPKALGTWAAGVHWRSGERVLFNADPTGTDKQYSATRLVRSFAHPSPTAAAAAQSQQGWQQQSWGQQGWNQQGWQQQQQQGWGQQGWGQQSWGKGW